MVTYEITVTVRSDLREGYEIYMTERHIPDLLATAAFESATFSRSTPGRYRIRYEARSRAALDEYLENHASLLRTHMRESFPEGIELSREEWDVIRSFNERPDKKPSP